MFINLRKTFNIFSNLCSFKINVVKTYRDHSELLADPQPRNKFILKLKLRIDSPVEIGRFKATTRVI